MSKENYAVLQKKFKVKIPSGRGIKEALWKRRHLNLSLSMGNMGAYVYICMHALSSQLPCQLLGVQAHEIYVFSLVFWEFWVDIGISSLKFIFNWRIIVIECCGGFCHPAIWISRKYTYIPPLLEPPSHPSSHPSRLSQSTGLSSLCYRATSY